MRCLTNPQQERVAHDHVRVRHINLGAEHVRTVGKLPGPHAAQQVEILVHRPVAVWARCAWRRYGAPPHANRRFVLRIHVRLSRLHEPLGDLIQLFEVVAGEKLA